MLERFGKNIIKIADKLIGGIFKFPKVKDKEKGIILCPLYDNGSSLCDYEDNNDIEGFFLDKMKFEELVNTKLQINATYENPPVIQGDNYF